MNAYNESQPRRIGMGAIDDFGMPWGKYSATTLEAQSGLNKELLAKGFCPIAEDGTLNAATCGAARDLYPGYEPPACQAFTPPGPCAAVPTKAGLSNGAMIAAGVAVLVIGAAALLSR